MLNDTTTQEFSRRIEALLGAAKNLRQGFTGLRALQDAANPGNTITPVPISELLAQVQDDFAEMADSSGIKLLLECTPAFVYGNAARLRSAFFHLFDYFLEQCGEGYSVRVVCRRIVYGVMVQLRGSAGQTIVPPRNHLDRRDLRLWIAQQAFRAAGGEMSVRCNEHDIDALVKLRLSASNHHACAGSRKFEY